MFPLRRSPRALSARAAFTLIEILIIVVVLGILAAIVMAQFSGSTGESERSSFISSARVLSEAATRYWIDNGVYPEDASSGVLPTGFEPYVEANAWGQTPIGGVWDTELNSMGVTSALGVHFNGTGETRDDAYMVQIDSAVDDGNLATGGFRRLGADRYYFVLAD